VMLDARCWISAAEVPSFALLDARQSTLAGSHGQTMLKVASPGKRAPKVGRSRTCGHEPRAAEVSGFASGCAVTGPLLRVASLGKGTLNSGFTRKILIGAIAAQTGRAVFEDFAIAPPRHERVFRSQTSSKGALTGNAVQSIGMSTLEGRLQPIAGTMRLPGIPARR